MNIDRKNIVTAHNPVLFDFDSPLSVGNGDFVFTADVTGLQSYPELYEDKIPLCTMSGWGLHTEQPGKFSHKDFKLRYYNSNGRVFGVPQSSYGQKECYDWLRSNPHRFNLAQISFCLDQAPLELDKISNIRQELDLWSGVLYSHFVLDGKDVDVKTCVHHQWDVLAASVQSSLLAEGRLTVMVKFPYGSSEKNASVWNRDDDHRTFICEETDNSVQFVRVLDDDKYFCKVGIMDMSFSQTAKHGFHFAALPMSECIEMTYHFANERIGQTATYWEAEKSSRDGFYKYWSSGSFIDFSCCTDTRAQELSRRVILSQYLTRIQCAGRYLPAETGLTCNSWFGKAHLEMHYWHSFHFVLFNKPELLEKSMWWYGAILDKAKELASRQGFTGARWPKMPWPNGQDSPSYISPLLIWQQPHPIQYSYALYECYLSRGDVISAKKILNRYRDIVFETAEFMSSFAYKDEKRGCYILGPGIIPAQENHQPEISVNPTFELEYWHYGLSRAVEWAELLGETPPERWIDVRDHLAPLPQKDGVYLAHENCPDTFTKFNVDHPSFLCAMGMLPGTLVNPTVMENTLRKTLEKWRYDELWGWDFPVMAMTAAALDMPETAVDCLLLDTPKNTFLINGHNTQLPTSLAMYLPGNGGLLAAVVMMCNGSGFPKDGGWDVKWEK